MTSSIDSIWIASEVGQKAALTAPLMPEAALSWRLIVWYCWRHWFLWDANLVFWVWFDAFRICFFAFSTLSLKLHPSLGSQFHHNQNLLHPNPHRWRLPAQGVPLSSIGWVLSKIGKSDFNGLKYWMWATRNWGDFLLTSGSFSRAGATKGLVSIGGYFDLRRLRGGRRHADSVTTVGSRAIGFRSFSCRGFYKW